MFSSGLKNDFFQLSKLYPTLKMTKVLLLEKVRKVGLYYFYWQKKFGKLNFVIFIGGKSSES
jgi:hypothetical protein